MGVPAFFRWLSEKYPKIISGCYEEMPQEVEGVEIPIDITGPNRNGEEFDNLYLDMNGIVHPCSHPEDRPAPKNEEEMMLAIFEYTERIVRIVRPRKILMMAVDGVAPRAKMNQQRSRRFRSALEAKKKEEEKEDFRKNFLKKQQSDGNDVEEEEGGEASKAFDSNVITPGTPFMDVLAQSLRYWTAYKLNTDPGWANLKIIISDATVPGEGEHKIMEFVRSQRQSPTHNPNTRHVIYGLDADLIMLGLATHEPHFRVLREDVFFQSGKPNACRKCGQVGHKAAECIGLTKQKEGEFDEKQKIPPKPYIWLHVNVLREYLEAELFIPNLPFKWNLERALDDWVFLCFFVGNDFLPHLPSLDIKEEGIDALTAIWRDNLALMGGYMTEDGHVNLDRAQYILSGLAKQEDAIFKRRKTIEDKREAGRKRRKQEEDRRKANQAPGLDSFDNSEMNTPVGQKRQKKAGYTAPDVPMFDPSQLNSREVRQMTHEQFVNRRATFQAVEANKSAAAVLKEQLRKKSSVPDLADPVTENGDAGAEIQTPPSALGKRKADLLDDDDNSSAGAGTPGRTTPLPKGTPQNDTDEPRPDDVRMWEDGYGDRYYERKFGVDPQDIKFRNSVANAYVEGLCWVLLYYMQGCPSWTWYYPHHYAPFAADFVDIGKLDIKFKKGKPFRPFEQLMGVLPAASNHAIPVPFRSLMEEEDSEIIDFYPPEFEIDLNGKKFDWQGVALLPFIDEKRLLAAMATKYPLLTEADHARNEVGQDALIFSGKHPLYENTITRFYSKKKGEPKFTLQVAKSHGLAGDILKHDAFIPSGPLTSPLSSGLMPDLDEDQSMSVYYEMPTSKNIHKSMLLRGLKMPTPLLDGEDIAKIQGRARNSGRNFGGVPLRENGQRNGRRMNFAAGPDYRANSGNNFGPPGGLPFPPPNGMPFPPPPPGFPPPGFSIPPPPAGVRMGDQFPAYPPPFPFPGGPPPPNFNAGGNYGGYQNGGNYNQNGGNYNQNGGNGRGYGGQHNDHHGSSNRPRHDYGDDRRRGGGNGGHGGYGGRR